MTAVHSNLDTFKVARTSERRRSISESYQGGSIWTYSESELLNGSSTPGSSDDEANPYSMTENILVERSKKRDRGNIYPQICACLVGPISTGYTIGYISTQMFKIYSNSTITEQVQNHAQYASIIVFGFALGNVVLTIVCLHKGPRRVLIIAAPGNLFAVLAVAVNAQHAYDLYLRFLWTFLSSSYTPCGLLLLGDLVHEANFYLCYMIFYAGTGFGIMLALIFGYNRHLEHFAEGMQALILLVYFLLLLYSDESPVILYETNRRGCERVLRTYRGNSDIPIIMRMIAKDCEMRKVTVNARYMFTFKVVYKAFVLLVVTALLQVVYLYYILLFYNMSMWGVTARSDRQFVIGQYWDGFTLGACYFLAPLISQMLQVRLAYGIRKPMIISAIGMPILLASLAIYLYLLETNNQFARLNKWPLLCLAAMLIVCYNIGHSGSIEQMIAEYLPEQMQIWASLAVISLRYTFVAIVLWITYMLQDVMYAYAVVAVFLLASLLGIPFCWCCIVEPKGKTLQQVQLEIGGNPIGSQSAYRRKYRRYWEVHTKSRPSRRV